MHVLNAHLPIRIFLDVGNARIPKKPHEFYEKWYRERYPLNSLGLVERV